jgi:hypothetical protein
MRPGGPAGAAVIIAYPASPPRWPSGRYHVRSGLWRMSLDGYGAPSDSGFVKSTQKTTVPIQQT